MDNTARAPERAAQQVNTADFPQDWVEAQEELASRFSLSLLLVEGQQPPSLAVSNNNSICHALQSSKEHAHRCQPDCGQAYFRAAEAGSTSFYRCHAGLYCFVAPVDLGAGKPLAVIGGRAFLRGADYRALAERIRAGDLASLYTPDLFNNVIFSLQEELEQCAGRVVELCRKAAYRKNGLTDLKTGGEESDASATMTKPPDVTKENAGDAERVEVEAPPARKRPAPPKAIRNEKVEAHAHASSLSDACNRAVKTLVDEHGLESLALLLRSDDSFLTACQTGAFLSKPPRVTLKPKEIKLLLAATHSDSIAVPAAGRASSKHEAAIELFPLNVADEIKGVLLVGDSEISDEQRDALAAFCRDIAMPMEVLRLRDELDRRMRAEMHLQAFTEIVNSAHPEDAYTAILRHSAELLRAERGSLLLFDEGAGELAVKAAVGPRAEVAIESRMRLGEGVAGAVLSEGRAVVVSDVEKSTTLRPAPAERKYKTGSFISYPIVVSGRRVGVLNVTDKAGGGTYDELDLTLLDLIAPQMALAIDRAEWHRKATQFQLLSITDPLTGLVNRRYLEERLTEELERSKRHRFNMSFLMLDIDDFKSYNDRHGHPAGDLALEMTAQCLKTALRQEDVAARYGGEEFSVLLPQTGQAEARVIAERIRRRIERTHFPHGKSQPHGAVTVSIGISSFGVELDTPATIIDAADKALYVAKAKGKNCIESYEAKKVNGNEGADAA